MSPFLSKKPNIDNLKEKMDLEGLVNASMQPDEKISKAAVNAIINLILDSYPPPLPPGGESLFATPTLKIIRLPTLCFIDRVPRSLAIERLSEIIRTGRANTTDSLKEGAAEMLSYLGSTGPLEQYLLDTKQEEQGIFRGVVVRCLAEKAFRTRDLMLLKELLVTEWSFDADLSMPCSIFFGHPRYMESVLKELEEKDLMDILIGASSTSARSAVLTALGSVGGLASLPLLSSIASEGIRAALTKLDREDAKRALQKSYNSPSSYKTINVVDEDAREIQGAAICALRVIIRRLPYNQILPLCESDQKHLRNAALLAACQGADPKALSFIISASQAEDNDIVMASIGALSKLGGSDAIPALLTLLKHHSHQIWHSAAVALSEIDDQEAVAGILGLQPDKILDPAVLNLLPHLNSITQAADALITALEKAPDKILDPAVLNLLPRLNCITQAADALITALEKAPHENRLAALELLAKVAPAEEVAPVQNHFAPIYAAELNDEKWAVRNRAVNSLGRIGGALALKALEERLKDEVDYDIRCEIEKILGLRC